MPPRLEPIPAVAEKAREAMRADVIEIKKHRRVAVGPNITVLFENRATEYSKASTTGTWEEAFDDLPAEAG